MSRKTIKESDLFDWETSTVSNDEDPLQTTMNGGALSTRAIDLGLNQSQKNALGTTMAGASLITPYIDHNLPQTNNETRNELQVNEDKTGPRKGVVERAGSKRVSNGSSNNAVLATPVTTGSTSQNNPEQQRKSRYAADSEPKQQQQPAKTAINSNTDKKAVNGKIVQNTPVTTSAAAIAAAAAAAANAASIAAAVTTTSAQYPSTPSLNQQVSQSAQQQQQQRLPSAGVIGKTIKKPNSNSNNNNRNKEDSQPSVSMCSESLERFGMQATPHQPIIKSNNKQGSLPSSTPSTTAGMAVASNMYNKTNGNSSQASNSYSYNNRPAKYANLNSSIDYTTPFGHASASIYQSPNMEIEMYQQNNLNDSSQLNQSLPHSTGGNLKPPKTPNRAQYSRDRSNHSMSVVYSGNQKS